MSTMHECPAIARKRPQVLSPMKSDDRCAWSGFDWRFIPGDGKRANPMRVLIGGFYKSYSPSNAVVSVMGLFVFGVLDPNAPGLLTRPWPGSCAWQKAWVSGRRAGRAIDESSVPGSVRGAHPAARAGCRRRGCAFPSLVCAQMGTTPRTRPSPMSRSGSTQTSRVSVLTVSIGTQPSL
jgi:hypothetical protein